MVVDCVWDKSAVYFYLRSSLTAADLVFFNTFATCDWLSCGCRVVGGGTPYWVIERSSPSLGGGTPFPSLGGGTPERSSPSLGAEPPLSIRQPIYKLIPKQQRSDHFTLTDFI